MGFVGYPMRCPSLSELPPAPMGKTGWPWTEPTNDGVSQLAPSCSLLIPRISLVMPCLNAGRYIEEALRSVLLQGYPDLELMVMDGGSTDGTIEIIKRYEPWLSHWESERDSGQSEAINKGLSRATGVLFNWVNADDIVCPNGLSVLVELYSRSSNCAGVFGAMEVFDERGYRETWLPVNGSKEEIGIWGRSAFLPQPSALFPCQLCKKIGGVNEALHYVMDVDLILRLADHGPFAVTNTPTYRFRHHQGSKTVRGETAGMVELISAEFNLGMHQVAVEWLKWRMDGVAKAAAGNMAPADVEKYVDSWSYMTVGRYLMRRLQRNLRVRLQGHKKSAC